MARSPDPWMVPIIKGMLIRGDDQSDIAACFQINAGRVSEINTGKAHPNVRARRRNLPPRGPYPSPYELLTALAAIEVARAKVDRVLFAARCNAERFT